MLAYRWTVEQIANMTPHQQLVALAGIQSDDNPLNETREFDNYDDYLDWMANK